MLKFAFNLIDDGLVGQQVFAGEATRLAYATRRGRRGARRVPGEARPRLVAVPVPLLVRSLLALPADPSALLEPLARALDGTGPAVLPLPSDAAAARSVLAAGRPDEPLEDDRVALVVPTSGSTGEPKAVLLTAAALRASAAATRALLGGPGRWLSAIPATHIGGLQVLVRSLLAGTTPVVLRDSFTAATAALGPGRTLRLARPDPAPAPAGHATATRCARTTRCCSAAPPRPRRCWPRRRTYAS